MIELIGLEKPALASMLEQMGQPRMRASQLWHWLYHQGAADFSRMTSLSKEFRALLSREFTIFRPKVPETRESADGTIKWLLDMNGAMVETVYIPEEDRGALCVSSQAGCALGCGFCRTGSMGFTRNLTAAEIVGQVLAARDILGEWPTPTQEGRKISNIVLMGMGEPLSNLDNVSAAARIMYDDSGIGISRRRITLSTAGIADRIPDVAGLGVKLAVSLHFSDNETRSRFMPVNRKYPLETLMAACRKFQSAAKQTRVTFEYLMIAGVNDSEADASRLIKLAKGLDAKFNLIPFNGWEGCALEPSSPAAMQRFAAILKKAGLAAPIRVSRGADIGGACGQLAGRKFLDNQ